MYKQAAQIAIMLIAVSGLFLAVLLGATGAIRGRLEQETGPSFKGATGWLNTSPLTLKDLRGKVVLIDFWTYTCINWRRTLPYVQQWALKYKDNGLIVVGVHTPEFSFEKKLENVQWAIGEMNISYPVVQDNNFAIWRAFENQYWPAIYLVDAKGRIRYHKFGEESYQEIEREIQRLLKEASLQDVPDSPVVLQPQGFEAAADWNNLQSPETYLNYSRGRGLASKEKVLPDRPMLYAKPAVLQLNEWALSGEWIVGSESVRLQTTGGKIVYRFHARDLHMVMRPTIPGTSINFKVLIDDKSPGKARGLDINSDGHGILKEERMYHLIRQSAPINDHEFQIEFLEPHAEVYVFTFG